MAIAFCFECSTRLVVRLFWKKIKHRSNSSVLPKVLREALSSFLFTMISILIQFEKHSTLIPTLFLFICFSILRSKGGLIFSLIIFNALQYYFMIIRCPLEWRIFFSISYVFFWKWTNSCRISIIIPIKFRYSCGTLSPWDTVLHIAQWRCSVPTAH
jgi:hypothetical protein